MKQDIQRIREAKIFDEAWYLRTYKDVRLLGMDPIEHYVTYGRAMGRYPDFTMPAPTPPRPATTVKTDNAALSGLVPNSYEQLIDISKRRDQGRALDATALRTGSVRMRDLFAWQALNRQGNLDTILSAIGALRDPCYRQKSITLLRSADRFWLSRLGRILALQNRRITDRNDAFEIYKFLFSEGSHRDLYQGSAKIFLDIALSLGDYDLARHILEGDGLSASDKRHYRTDLGNPTVNGPDPTGKLQAKWLADFNQVFRNAGVESIDIAPNTGLPLMDSIICDAPAASVKGPKVTVVISVWQPDQDLRSAVRSILNQTWENLEILLVDDACGPEFDSIIQDCVRMDDRIRLLRAETNRGTYAARNLAIKNATGAFMTFQDSDDWSHPRRIEKQVSQLLSNPDLIANTSRTVRASKNLVLSDVGYLSPERMNTSSLMFRFKEATEKIGFYDSVRKGADIEYLERLKAVFGADSCQNLPDILSIIRIGHASLSRVDFKPGFHHPSRTNYRGGYILWHNKIREGIASPYMSDMQEPRPFPVPDRFNLDKSWTSGLKRRHYDVVLAGDWRADGGPQNSMLTEIAAFKEAGYSVAILHMEAMRFMTSRMAQINIRAQELLNAAEIGQVCIDDHVDTNLLLLRYPPILQLPSDLASNIRAKSAILVVNQAPHEVDGSDIRYEPHICIKNAREVFGIDPVWAPQGPLVRDMIAGLIPAQLLTEQDMTGFIDAQAWAPVRRALSGPKPVIGRYSRDAAMKFPSSRSDLLACYPDDDRFDIRIMGGKLVCKSLLGTDIWPKNWTIYDYGTKHSREFLDEVDFFVYFDNPSILEAFGRSILEAIASGRVTILPRKFERVFGEGAIYCEPQEVAGVINNFWTNPDQYRAQSETALRCVNGRFSSTAFLEKIRKLVPDLGLQPE